MSKKNPKSFVFYTLIKSSVRYLSHFLLISVNKRSPTFIPDSRVMLNPVAKNFSTQMIHTTLHRESAQSQKLSSNHRREGETGHT